MEERFHTRWRDAALVSRASLYYNRMVVGMAETERADALFHALADPTRRDILAVVLCDAHSVSDLARRYPISFAAVHKHVGALERAGLVTKTRHGREQHVRGAVATLRSAHRLLDELEALWRGRIEGIEQLLADPTEGAPPCP
jgi:DNA-binding transcriptional ArsR family regulator